MERNHFKFATKKSMNPTVGKQTLSVLNFVRFLCIKVGLRLFASLL